jgi:hypothetical protein
MTYEEWISENVEGDGYGKCDEYTLKMQAVFPELTRMKGFYHCPIWGQRTHWWLITDFGEVVDPTKAQFPSKGTCEYEELLDIELEDRLPCGKCMNCGEEIYKKNFYASDMCSEECGKSFLRYLNDPFAT